MNKWVKKVFSILVVLVSMVSICVPTRVVKASENSVAHTGNKALYFDSISSAWDYALKNDEIIVLDKDWELSSYLTVSEGKKITLELNGHKICRNLGSAVDDGYIFKVGKNASLNLYGTERKNTEFTYKGYNSDGTSNSSSSSELKVTTGGLVTGGNNADGAGAIYMLEKSNLNLYSVAINGNANHSESKSIYGGAIAVCGELVKITMNDAHIDHNYSYIGGGGIGVTQKNVEINMTDSSISYNLTESLGLGQGYGGGIMLYDYDNTINMKNSTIDHNRSSGNGGGIYAAFGRLYVNMDNSHIDSNVSYNENGGGVYMATGNIKGISNSTISNNKSYRNNSNSYGGGIYLSGDASESNRNNIIGVTIKDNESDIGGGIYLKGNYTLIDLCEISGNKANSGKDSKAGKGGGIYNGANCTIVRATSVTGNTCTNVGGGIYAYGPYDITFEDCIKVTGNKGKNAKNDNVYLCEEQGTDGNLYYSSIRGTVNSYSEIGISYNFVNDRKAVVNISKYYPNVYQLDNTPTNYYLDYNSSSKELWLRKGEKTYTLTINGFEVGKYTAGKSIGLDMEAFKWVLVDDAGSKVFKTVTHDMVKNYSQNGNIIEFTMPNENVSMTASFVTKAKDFTLTVAEPATGEAFPSEGTLTWNNGANSKTVPVYWVKGDEQKQATGTVGFNTEYSVVASIGQDLTNDLAFANDITNANVLVKYGDNDASASTIAQVDSSGTLNLKGTKIKSVSTIASVQTKRYDTRRNTTVESLKAKLKGVYNATVTLKDGSMTTVLLDTDNMIIPETMMDESQNKIVANGTITIPILASSLSEKNLINTDDLKCTVNVVLYNAWAAGAPTLDKAEGTYTGTSLDITASLGENATTLYYTVNGGNVVTTTDTTINLSLAEGENSKEFKIVAWDGNPDISSLQDSDAITRTYTLQRGEEVNAVITSIPIINVSIAEGSTEEQLRAAIPTTASVNVRKDGDTTDTTITLNINADDISNKVVAGMLNSETRVVDYKETTTSFEVCVVLQDGITNPNSLTLSMKVTVTKNKEIVATPVVTASGTKSKLTLTATCGTEGATIKYIYDGETDVHTYDNQNPIVLSVRSGETKSNYSIAFWAEKDGYESSDVYTGNYVVENEVAPVVKTVTVVCKDTSADTLTELKTETYEFESGSTVQLIAPPITGKKFEKWVKGDGTVVETSNIDLGELTDNVELTAIYNPIITELDLTMSVPEASKTLAKNISGVKAKVVDSYDPTTGNTTYKEVDLTQYFKADNMTWLPDHTIAEPLTSYIAKVPLVRDGNSTSQKKYVLAEDVTVKINGSDSTAKVTQVIKDNDIVAYVSFDKTGKLTAKSIQPLEDLTVSYVDAYDMQTKQEAEITMNVWNLPTKAIVVIDEETKYTIDTDITWNIPEKGFDKTNPDAQTFTVTGTLDIPEYLDLGAIENKIEITVKVDAQQKAPTPTSSVPSGTYNADKLVSLNCDVKDATLYYTLDGSEPTVNSTEYKGAFDVTETTTIKVFAVRAGMKDSDVATYTIKIDRSVQPTNNSSSTTKKTSGWDDGGPFTTDKCGNVYDRWGNKIYEAKACNVGGYNLVGTSTKD